MSATVRRRRRRGPGSRVHVLRRVLASFVSPNSYGMVLALIVTTYVIAVSAPASWAPLVLFVQAGTVWIALRTSRALRVVRIVADVVLVVATILAIVEIVGGLPDRPPSRLFAASAVLYLIAPISAIRHLVTRPKVDLETVLGAIASYLMIGMCFAFAYRFVGLEQAGPFFGSAGDGTIDQVLFFSFTTLTTTGYGNFVPAANPGQSLAVAQMLIGQLFLIAAVGKVISNWQPSRRTAEAVVDETADGSDAIEASSGDRES